MCYTNNQIWKNGETSFLLKFIIKEVCIKMNVVESSSLINDILSHKNLQDNLSVPGLVEKVLSRDEGILTSTGAVRATTGAYTGRSPNDKFIVRDEVSEDIVERSEEH